MIEVGAGERDRTPKAKIVRRKLDGKERKEGGKVRKDRERLERSQEVLVLGDSRIRYLDETFCEADKARRMSCCLPGGRSAGHGRYKIQESSGGDGEGGVSGGSRGRERCRQGKIRGASG